MNNLISIRAFSLQLLPILISLSLLIPIAFSQQSDLLNKVCTNTSQNYTDGSAYASNLKYLLDDLVKKTPKNNLFWKETSGQGPNDIAYGLALCRGDVSPDDCDFCLYDARCKITQRCHKKSAIVWYDYCQLKYSDLDFFGHIDNSSDNVWINVNNVTNRKNSFKEASIGLLSTLSKQASSKGSKYMFARGEKLFSKKNGKNVTIYGMVQCTRDLSYESCEDCLNGVAKKLPIYDGTIYSEGARVFGASCTVRYETYPFLNDNKASV
ncbi:cysteine-rich repeat secretory protein 38 [Phtheirospermum japonicum]|uniref:Cysteine-rich repeat secretory protein 38 n=1 Tax=Phtheirospermum japonicum TaxID=374723 RepID=A0A830CBK1_9LAMI|nr:cysteine-rich repeat secretory protein 38 [Phtheirospermum japonicum]